MNINIDFNTLTDEEITILFIFIILMNRVNYGHMYKLTNQSFGEGNFGLYKDEQGWNSFVYEKGQKVDLHTYDSLNKACINIFKHLKLEASNYCLDMFPKFLNEDYDMNFIYDYFKIKRDKTKSL